MTVLTIGSPPQTAVWSGNHPRLRRVDVVSTRFEISKSGVQNLPLANPALKMDGWWSKPSVGYTCPCLE